MELGGLVGRGGGPQMELRALGGVGRALKPGMWWCYRFWFPA